MAIADNIRALAVIMEFPEFELSSKERMLQVEMKRKAPSTSSTVFDCSLD